MITEFLGQHSKEVHNTFHVGRLLKIKKKAELMMQNQKLHCCRCIGSAIETPFRNLVGKSTTGNK